MNAIIPVFAFCLLLLVLALSSAGGAHFPGRDCTSGTGLGLGGKSAHDHTLIGIAEVAQAPGTSGDYVLGDGCLVFGDSVVVAIYGPNASVPLTIEQYDLSPAPLDVWHPPVYNGTPSPLNLTTPGYWANSTVYYRSAPQWSNVTLAVSPWTTTTVPLTLPSEPHARRLSISYDGADYEMWHVTPTSLLPLAQSVGQQWGRTAEFSVLMVALAGASIVLGSSAARDLLAPPRKKSVAVVVLLLAVFVVAVGSDYLSNWQGWQMALGGVGSYTALLVPEFFALTTIVVMVWPTRAVYTGELRLNGTAEDGDPTLDLPGYWVAKHPDGGYAYVPRGLTQGFYRLLLGKRAYCPLDDRVLARYPFRFRVTGVLARCYVVPAGRKTEVVLPHVEFWVRDPVPSAHEEWSEDSIRDARAGIDRDAALPTAPAPGQKGRLHILRFAPGYRAVPAVGKTEAKLILQHVAEELAVSAIEQDRQVLENENIDLKATVETGKAQRARELLRRFFAGASHAREEPKVSASEALRQALAHLESQQTAQGVVARGPPPKGGSAA